MISPRVNEFGRAYERVTGIAPVFAGSCAWVYLPPGPVFWRQHLRKSYKSLLNWGRRHLMIFHVDQSHPSRDLFDEFQNFHADVSGRVTRCQQSWDLQYDEIISGRGTLIIAYRDEWCSLPIGGSLFIDGKGISVYWTGAYDRVLQEQNCPIAHYLLWHGMELARERGNIWLELGAIDGKTYKEKSIGFFKQGFATHVNSSCLEPPNQSIADSVPDCRRCRVARPATRASGLRLRARFLRRRYQQSIA